MTADEKDFLARWSRRKQAAREEIDQPEPEPEQLAVPAEAVAEPPAEGTAVDDEAYADVDFDALDYESDYTRFMGKDVPEMVRRRALRALWRSDPILANVDGLNDYDDDFTDAAMVVENLVSAYKPGRGYATAEDEAVGDADTADVAGGAREAEGASDEPAAIEQCEDVPLEPDEMETANAALAEDEDDDPSKR